MNRSLWKYRLIALLSLGSVRGFLWVAYLATPIPFGPVSDSWLYVRHALEWLETGTMPPEAALHPPLYPYLLAFLFKMFGPHFYIPLLLQNLCGVLTGMLILEWVLELRLSTRTFWITLVFLLLSGPIITMEWKLFPETCALTTQILLLDFLRRRQQNELWSIPAALACSWLILLRPNFILLIPLLLLGALLSWRHRRHSFFSTAAWIVIPLLCLLPFFARNARLGAGYTLSSNSGITLYQGNNPSSRGMYNPLPSMSTDIVFQQRQSQRASDDEWRAQAFEFMLNHPGAALENITRKLFLFLSPRETTEGIDFPYPAEREAIPSLWILSLVNFLLLLLLSAAGWKTFASTGFPRLPVLSLLGVTWFTCLAFFVHTRYRLPAWPILILPASIGLTVLFESRNALARGLLFAGFVIGILPLFSRATPSERMTFHHNAGVAWEHAGNPTRAEIEYREALNIDPNDRPTLENVSRLYLNSGDLPTAFRVLTQLQKKHPDSPIGASNRSVLFLRLGRFQEARTAALEALRLNPPTEAPWVNYAIASYRLSSLREACPALSHLRRSNRRTEIQEIRAACDRRHK